MGGTHPDPGCFQFCPCVTMVPEGQRYQRVAQGAWQDCIWSISILEMRRLRLRGLSHSLSWEEVELEFSLWAPGLT